MRERCDGLQCSSPVSQVVQYDGDATEHFCAGCFDSMILDRLHHLRNGATCTVQRTSTHTTGRTYWLVR